MYSRRRRTRRLDIRPVLRYFAQGLTYSGGMFGSLPPAGLHYPNGEAAHETWPATAWAAWDPAEVSMVDAGVPDMDDKAWEAERHRAEQHVAADHQDWRARCRTVPQL